MRKLILAVVAILGFATMQAQVTVQGSKLSDNWSIGLNGMGITPLTNHAFWKNMRAGVGLNLDKQITPIFGMTVEGNFYINPNWNPKAPLYRTHTIFDASNVSLLGRINLMNLFGTYQGTPRFFEMEAVAGAGWLHSFGGYTLTNKADHNAFSTKVGLNLNFNLGESKAWTIAVKPAIVWNMDGDVATTENHSQYNANNAYVELGAGIVYHFGNSNGTHHFTLAKAYDQAEIDGLNAKINGLRNDLNNKDNELNNANAKINQLTNDLNNCLNRKPEVVNNTNNSMESAVTFAQGKTVVPASQLPNVERVATYMKNHKDSKVIIKGYASPEGGAAINAKLAQGRADAVKDILVKKYKIAANRIDASGQGVGNMFSEPDWNRVSICTLDEAKK